MAPLLCARLTAAAVAALVLTGCGADADPLTDATSELGCTSTEPFDSSELYVAEAHTCETSGDGTLRVYVFADTDDRDSWVAAAGNFGTEPVDTGERWAAVEA